MRAQVNSTKAQRPAGTEAKKQKMTKDATELHSEDEEDVTEQHLENEEDATELHSEDGKDASNLHLEVEKLKDEMEDARSQDEGAKDEFLTPAYPTPSPIKPKRSIVRIPRLTARKKIIRDFWRKEVEGQTEKEASKIYEAMMFSPGPGQVSATKMKKMMDMIIEERVQEALEEKLKTGKSKGVVRRLFDKDDKKMTADEDEEKKRYQARVEKLIQQDERLREEKIKQAAKAKAKAKSSSSSREVPVDKKNHEVEVRDEETMKKQKEAWKQEQDMIKSLQKELEAEKKKNHELEEQWLKAQREAQFQYQDDGQADVLQE